MSITVHPITVDPETQRPVYTAQDYRRGVNSLLFPSNGSTFNSLNCVNAASPTHVLTVSGSVVTVLPHSGFMSPFAGEAPYTYTITGVDGDNKVTMTAATGHYKIAVVVTDPSAGQGATPGGELAVYSSSTVDSAIPGIVLGEYDNGTVTDTAVRWQNQGVLIASTLTQLNTMAAVNGQLARVNGVEYKRENGAWLPVNKTIIPSGVINSSYWTGSDVRVSVIGDVVFLSCSLRRLKSTWSGDTDDNVFCTLPAELAPNHKGWVALEPRYGVWLSVGGTVNGVLPIKFNKSASFTLPLPVNEKLDFYAFWHLGNV